VPLTARNFEIRDFHPDDFETLWRIDQECFPPGISYSKAELKTYMRRPGSFTLVAAGVGDPEVDRQSENHKSHGALSIPKSASVAGFIVAEAQKHAGHIITIDVVAAERKNGLGSRLLAAAEERLQKQRCRSVELETAVDNVAAISFYKRHGYHVVAAIPHYYSNGVDALVLEKHFEEKRFEAIADRKK